MASIARHCAYDIPEFPSSATATSCGYAPDATDGGVVNAAAYRAWVLASASQVFSEDEYWKSAERKQAVIDELAAEELADLATSAPFAIKTTASM